MYRGHPLATPATRVPPGAPARLWLVLGNLVQKPGARAGDPSNEPDYAFDRCQGLVSLAEGKSNNRAFLTVLARCTDGDGVCPECNDHLTNVWTGIWYPALLFPSPFPVTIGALILSFFLLLFVGLIDDA